MTAYTKTALVDFGAHVIPADAYHAETQNDCAKAEFIAGNWSWTAGTANYTAAATLDITHGLGVAPTKVVVTGSDANSATLWVTAIGTTTFTINRGNSTGTPAIYWVAVK